MGCAPASFTFIHENWCSLFQRQGDCLGFARVKMCPEVENQRLIRWRHNLNPGASPYCFCPGAPFTLFDHIIPHGKRHHHAFAVALAQETK